MLGHFVSRTFILFASFIACTGVFAIGQNAHGQDVDRLALTHRFADAPFSSRDDAIPSDTKGSKSEEDSDLSDLDALLDTDVSQLRNTQVAPSLQMEVSSVSRQKSTVGKSPAAVFVITQEMIHRSGYRSIPEVLRMAPGLHVAKVGSSKWSVSARGFSNVFNQQLLVQIDGRSIYTPIFGGVAWNWHDMLLDNVERIEVIRGPGSTVWGANAVNGVINIITKTAGDTQGVFVEGGGGTEDRAFAGFRVGGTESNGVNWRISGKWFDRDGGFHPAGLAYDGWEQGRLNMRMDWQSAAGDQITVQGGMFEGQNGITQATPFIPLSFNQTPVSGGNFLFRWTREHSADSDTTFQAWADQYNSGNNLDYIHGEQTTVDLDLQHRRKWRERHSLIWGAGFRNVWDELPISTGLPLISFSPVAESYYIASAFIQDEIEVEPDKIFFTIGTKISTNSFTGFEVQPTIRLLNAIDDRTVAWAAVSRAVRLPSRTDLNASISLVPGFLTSFGNPNAQSEPVMAYEIGYRKQPTKRFSWDATLFFNDYNDLGVFVQTSPMTINEQNVRDVQGFGAEIASQLELSKRWKLQSWYSFLRLEEKHVIPTATAVVSPRHQAFVMSTFNLTQCADLDLMARYVDDIRGQDISAYIQADVRFAWRPRNGLELSIVGQNLLQSVTEEFPGNSFVPDIATQSERGVYGMIQFKY